MMPATYIYILSGVLLCLIGKVTYLYHLMDVNQNCCKDLGEHVVSETNNNSTEVLFKVLIIGDVGVGKSSVLQRFVENVFRNDYGATIGVDFKTTKMDLRGKFVKLQIWDTAGHERFRTMTSAFYRGAHGAVFVYDVTRAETFTSIPRWLKELDIYDCNNMVKILFGNKCDLSSVRTVSRETACEFADSRNMLVFETSAKTGEQVCEAFLSMVSRMLDDFDEGYATRKANYTEALSKCFLSKAENMENMLNRCSC